MSRVSVVTDTCACVPESLARDLGLVIVPYYIHRDSQTLRDMVDVRQDEFYRWLTTAEELPKTANPGPGDYLQAYEAAVQSGAEALVVICMTSKGSGAYQSALIAREMAVDELPGLPIEVVDTLQVSMAHGWAVIEGARAARSGATLDKVSATARDVASKAVMIQTADTLRYLYLGGRIGRAQHLVGSLLNIKPLIGMQDGVIVALGKALSRRRVYQMMIDLMADAVGPSSRIKIAFMHAAAATEVGKLRTLVEGRFDCVESFVTELNPALGVHTGPGLVGLSFYPIPA